jgi:Cu(I)/Ag(I) efflux system protein CusF
MRSNLVAVALAGLLASLGLTAPALAQQGHGAHAQVPQTAEGRGVVRAVNAQQGSVTIAHEAMPALGWPAMTMAFRVRSAEILNGIAVGARVHFVLANEDGRPVVTAIHVLS